LELSVVMPTYNEEACITEVVQSWRDALEALGMPFLIVVLNDGSTDGTEQALAAFESDYRVAVVTKPNSGHGPTILWGYRDASQKASWVFQVDADNEMDPRHFASMWKMRDDYDALLGVRTNREQSLGRMLISAVSRVVIRLAYAPGVDDVNVPYRLIRASMLAPIANAIPDSTFAPNLVVSGTLALARARIANIPVPHRNRPTGSVSIVGWRLWVSASRSLAQTIGLAGPMRKVAREIRTGQLAASGVS
jgi:dolichol-phosphate mannosyltransferase